jgi:hypothetical protein
MGMYGWTLRCVGLGMALAGSAVCWGQAPAGPLPQTESKGAAPAASAPQASQERTKNLAGAWSWNAEESDDARKVVQQARGSSGHGGGHGPRISGGLGGPGGYGGVGMGGRGGGRRSSGGNDEQREEMQEVFRPPNTLTFTQKDSEIDVMDDQGRRRTYFTDGRKIEKSKDANDQNAAAKWDDYRLVSEEKGPNGNKIEKSYEVAPGGQQLWETLHFSGRDKTPVTIRYVYDRGLGPVQPHSN